MSIVYSLYWFLTLILAGWIAEPFVSRGLLKPFGVEPKSPVVYGLAIPIGVFALGIVYWFLAFVLKTYELRQVASYAVPIVLILLRLAYAVRDRRLNPPNLVFGVTSLVVFLVLCLIRSAHPELTWGERPMDSSFLHYFSRLPQLPPTDPWMSENPMRYYYWGSFLWGFWCHWTHIPASYGYQLAMVSTFFLSATSLQSLFLFSWPQVKNGVVQAWWLPVFVLFTSNFEALRLWFQSIPLDLNYFWSTSRVFESPAFSEFPIWSFLFNDLHAHVMALPVFLTFVVLLLLGRQGTELRVRLGYASALGAVGGILLGVNVWHGMVAGILALILFSGGLLSGAVAISVCTLILFFLWPSLKADSSFFHGFYAGPYNSLTQVLRFSGHVVLPAAALTLWHLVSPSQQNAAQNVENRVQLYRRIAFWAGVPLLAIWGFVSISMSRSSSSTHVLPWGILLLSSTMNVMAGFLIVRSQNLLRCGAMMIWVGALFVGALEVIQALDRMNLIFKFYVILIPLFAIATFILWMERGASLERMGRIFAAVYLGVLLLATLPVAWSYLNVRFVAGPRPTLDGQAYLNVTNPAEKTIFDWVNHNVIGTSIALEAPGGHYDGRARLSMHTGLPIFLGWEFHVSQRGGTKPEIQRRLSEGERIYRTENANEAADLCLKNRIEWVFVGREERERFSGPGINKFWNSPLFQIAKEQSGVALFRVILPPILE